MKTFVQSLSNEFLAEAKASPRMFEDLAAMEHYMAESYDGRAFVEMLQNADDANATSISIFACGADYIITNNGRSFSKDDLIAICRSGASSKRRGSSIGYRGIGFKSATSISTEIIIYSSGVFFSFSKSRCADVMHKSPDQVPTVRIPFLVDDKDIGEDLHRAIQMYESKGFTTFFIFKNGNRDKLLAELIDFSSGWLLFLKHIEHVAINLAHLTKTIDTKRRAVKDGQCLFIDNDNNQSWLIISGKNNSAIAFNYDQHIIPCNNNEALFHCFSPTMDSSGFPFKVSADFSTDPSRKHIIIDDDNTRRGLESIVGLIITLLSDSSFDNQPYLIDLIASHSGISEASSYLDRELLNQLKIVRWIPLQDGTQISVSEYKMIPSWFDCDTRKKVFSSIPGLGKHEIKTEVMHIALHLNDLLLRCGCQPYGAVEFGVILSNINVVAILNDDILGKLWGYILRSVFSSSLQIKSFFLKDIQSRIISFSSVQEPVLFSEDFLAGIKGVLNKEELLRASELTAFGGLAVDTILSKKAQTPGNHPPILKKIEFSKLKTPVQNCMINEQFLGRFPKDVSKKSLGYDIVSADENGRSRYFSVKQVGSLGDSFSLNENEYDFAEEHGSSYGVYVIEKSNPENNYLIADISRITFEKRVREWEWVCDDYEVIKPTQPEETLGIDSKFLKDFSLQYLNHIQIAFLKSICEGTSIASFEDEYSSKASSITTQINGIAVFYLGDNIIENDYTIKEKYIGAIKYLLKQNNL